MQSNYYAYKVYEEHPLAVWPLDEELTYVSMLRTKGDFLSGWEVVSDWNADILPVTTRTFDVPVDKNPTYTIDAATYESNPPANTDIVIHSLQTYTQISKIPFSVFAYVMAQSAGIAGFEIGIVQKDQSNNWTEYSTATSNNGSFSAPLTGEWLRIYKNFDEGVVGEFKFYIKYTHANGIDAAISVHVNSLSAGESSKNYISYDQGILLSSLPVELEDVFDSSIKLEKSYALAPTTDPSAYYAIRLTQGNEDWNDSFPLAKNDGIPMVFGASNSTALYEHESMPALVIDGYGMLHENGRYNKYTLEFWMRQGHITKDLPRYTTSPTAQMIKFFGPVSTTDGLYRDDTHIYLCVGDQIASHQIGNWYRPMLVSLKYKPTGATLVINGEQVCSVEYDTSVPLASTASPDWFGFYNSGIDLFEIDCISIFPYWCQNLLIKRRYAVGQGVDELNSIESKYLGRSLVIDYTKSDYTRNLIYPTTSSWRNGVFSNLMIDQFGINVTEYEKPQFLSGQSKTRWIDANASIQNGQRVPSFIMQPEGFAGLDTTLLFENVNFVSEGTQAVQFDVTTNTYQSLELFHFYNNFINEKITFYFDGVNLQYSYGNQNKVTICSIEQYSIVPNTGNMALDNSFGDSYYNLGQNIELLNTFYFDGNLAYADNDFANFYVPPRRTQITINLDYLSQTFNNFFAYKDAVEMVVGGQDDVFNGYIHAISFFNQEACTVNNLSTEVAIDIVNSEAPIVVGTYTYGMQQYVNTFTDAVFGQGYWKDIIPLSYFAKETFDSAGNKMKRIDLMQFNLWIDDCAKSGLQDKVVTTVEFVETDSVLTLPTAGEYSGTDVGRWLELGENFINQKYVVHNGTVITFNNDSDIDNLFVVIRLNVAALGSLQKVLIRKMEICSLTTYEDDKFFSIGTRYGENIFPVKMNDTQYIPVSKAPIRITKESAPYLRATDDSGIGILPQVQNNEIVETAECLTCIINTGPDSLAGLKFWMLLDDVYADGIIGEKKIADAVLELEEGTVNYEFWVVPPVKIVNDRPYAYEIEVRKEGVKDYAVRLFQNIYQTVTPIAEPRRWTQISLVFDGHKEMVGNSYFNMYSGAMFQNISFHRPSITALEEMVARRAWYSVKFGPEPGRIIEEAEKTDGVVTLKITGHGLEVGNYIYVRMDEATGFDGQFQIESKTADTVTYDMNDSETIVNSVVSGTAIWISDWDYWRVWGETAGMFKGNSGGVNGENIWSDVLYLSNPANMFFDAYEMTNAIFGTIAIVAEPSSSKDMVLKSSTLDALMDVRWSTNTITPV